MEEPDISEGEDNVSGTNIFCDVLAYLDKFISSLVESIVEKLRAGLKVKLSSYKSET